MAWRFESAAVRSNPVACADRGLATILGSAVVGSAHVITGTLIGIACLLPLALVAGEAERPATVEELFADVDPRKDPLDTVVVREWETDGIVHQTVTFHVGTFKGTPARMAAFYAFPKGATRAAAPLLWLGVTNDFHGIMDDTYRTGAMIPRDRVRYAFTPHMNHRFTPEFAVTRPLWFGWDLRGIPALPRTPATRLILDSTDRIPRLEVRPDSPEEVAEVHVYHSADPDTPGRASGGRPTWRGRGRGHGADGCHC